MNLDIPKWENIATVCLQIISFSLQEQSVKKQERKELIRGMANEMKKVLYNLYQNTHRPKIDREVCFLDFLNFRDQFFLGCVLYLRSICCFGIFDTIISAVDC